MLVLARKEDESIVIGNDITVYVRKISPTRVRIAIDAPPHVRIARMELQDDVVSSHRIEESVPAADVQPA